MSRVLSEDFFRVIVFVTFVTFVMGARSRSRSRNRRRNRNRNRTRTETSKTRDGLKVDVILH